MAYKNHSAEQFASVLDSLCPQWLENSGFMADIYQDLIDAKSNEDVAKIMIQFDNRLGRLHHEIREFLYDVRSDVISFIGQNAK